MVHSISRAWGEAHCSFREHIARYASSVFDGNEQYRSDVEVELVSPQPLLKLISCSSVTV